MHRSGVNAALPWVMLMSGTFGYSQDHSFLLQQLAGRGYLVAIVDQNHPINTLKLPLPGEHAGKVAAESCRLC